MDQAAKKPAVAADIGTWEKHTKGIGLKLLQKFGFTGRLGAKENGVSRAIEVVVRPTNTGIGFGDVKEASTLKVNKQIEAEWRGVEYVDEDLEKKKSAVERLASAKGWKKGKKSTTEQDKPKVKLTAEDFLNKYMADEATGGNAVNQKQVIIDMRHKETRVLTDMNDIGASSEMDNMEGVTPKLGQELLYNINMLADMEEMHVSRDSRLLAQCVRHREVLAADRAALERGVEKEAGRLARLQKVQLILTKIDDKLNANGDNVAGDISLQSICALLRTLHENFAEEFQIFGLINLLPHLISRVVSVKDWDPFVNYDYLSEIFDALEPLGEYFESAQQLPLARQARQAFYETVEQKFLPIVRRRISSAWKPETEVGPCVRLMEALRLVLPPAMFEQTVDMFLLPRLTAAVGAWRPAFGHYRLPTSGAGADGADAGADAGADSGVVSGGAGGWGAARQEEQTEGRDNGNSNGNDNDNDNDNDNEDSLFDPRQAAVHRWLLPWIPLLTSKLSSLYPEVRRKFGVLFSSWDAVRDALPAIGVLQPWLGVFDATSFENLLVRSVVPKLVYVLREGLVINPAQQDIAPVEAVLAWVALVPVMPVLHLSCLLVGELFPKWLRVLHTWLTSSSSSSSNSSSGGGSAEADVVDFEEVTAWYAGWKELIPAVLQAEDNIVQCFNIALEMMQAAMMAEDDSAIAAALQPFEKTLETLESTNYFALIEQRKMVQRAQRRLEAMEAEEANNYAKSVKMATVAGFGAGASSSKQITFKEILESFAARNNVEFTPRIGKFYEGKQLWQFGRATCYMEQNVVFVSTNDKTGKRELHDRHDSVSKKDLYGWRPVDLEELLSLSK
jgi:hypothetical protein